MKDDAAKKKAIQKFVGDNFNPTEKEKDGEEGKILIIREGQAPKQLDAIKPNKVHLTGAINSPSEFYKKRKELHNPNKCHVIFDRNAGEITLVVDEQFENDNYKITGKIAENPDLKDLHINDNHLFGAKDLMGVIKFNRILFVDKEENNSIVLALQNFKAKVEKTLADTSDLRGNEEKSKLIKLEHELQENFKLNMPIFKGGKSVVFQVDICVTATSADVQFWLESRELKELQDGNKSQMIEDELKNFKDIVCIEK